MDTVFLPLIPYGGLHGTHVRGTVLYALAEGKPLFALALRHSQHIYPGAYAFPTTSKIPPSGTAYGVEQELLLGKQLDYNSLGQETKRSKCHGNTPTGRETEFREEDHIPCGLQLLPR